MVYMDGNVKLWSVNFRNGKDEDCGGAAFNTPEEAKAFVDRYIAKG